MRHRLPLTLLLALLFSLPALALGQEAPATQPGDGAQVIPANDKEALAAAMGQEVVVEGTIREAAWSRSGKVMNVEFADAEESRLLAVVFQRSRERLDEAFGGDFGKAVTGAKVRLKGKLQEYGGYTESMKGRPQLVIGSPSQVTIVEAAPSTAPAQ